MHWKKAFPGKYLQAADLDTPIEVIITLVVMETIGGEAGDRKKKPVVRFEESDVKPMIANPTRAEAIEAIAGDGDMEHWPGTRIRLERGWTRYQGKRVACICVVAPSGGGESLSEEVGF